MSTGNRSTWLAVIVLALFFFGVSLWSSPSQYEVTDALLLGVLYLGLAAFLQLGALRAMLCGVFPGLIASFVVGSVLVWHIHEQTRLPDGKPALILAAATVGLVYFGMLRTQFKVTQPEISWWTLALIAASFSGLLIVAFHQSNTFRWHLLRHNTLIGTPAYYLLSTPLESVEQHLFAEPSEPRTSTPARAVDLPAARPGTRPHILFVLIDTLRADALDPNPDGSMPMPRLAQWAEESHQFSDVMANSSWTMASVGSFFTGRLPDDHGAVDFETHLPADEVTLAEALGRSGYRTAAFVANYAQIGRATGFDQGFDHFVELRKEHHGYVRAASVTNAVRDAFSRPEAVFDPASDEPLFLYVHYLDPHLPYLSGVPNSVIPSIARRGYAAELAYLDRELTNLLQFATDKLPGPWVTFVTADHGEEFGEHGGNYMRHGHSLYSEVLSIPAVLRTPAGRRGMIRAPLEARDFYDLILELSNAPDMDVNEWAVRKRRKERRASVYLTSDFPIDRPYLKKVIMRGLERNGFFAIWSGYGGTLELYDVRIDPGQRINVVRKHPELASEFLQAISSSPRPRRSSGSVELSDENRRQLRDLGYIQ